MNLLFIGSLGRTELLMVLLLMLPGMLAIFLILKYEKGAAMPAWILAVFFVPILGWLSYLVKYFIIDKRRTL